MKVEKVQQNYLNSIGKKNSPSFQKKGDLASRIVESLPDKKAIKRMEKMEWLKGEAGGIAITAFGTGFVAPWPIAFNPFVKAPKGATEEEIDDLNKTKKYTAMRQVVSMVLAIVFQLGALKPIDILTDKLFNKEEYAKRWSIHVDQSAINKKSYLERLVKKEMKKEGIKAPSITKIFTDGWSSYKKASDEFDSKFSDRVSQLQNKQIDDVAKKLQETGKIHVGKRTLDNETLAGLINDQIDDYVSDAKKLRIETDGLAFYTNRAETLVKNEEHLKEIFKDVANKDAKQLETHLKDILSKEQNPKVKELIQEILDRPEDIRKSHINRTFERINTIKEMCGKEGFSMGRYFDALGARNTELDRTITRLKKAKIKNVNTVTQEEINKAIQQVIENCKFDKESQPLLNSIMHDTVTFDSDKAKLTKKINKDITKRYKKFVENTYKGRNQVIKVLVGVFITLPITCNALNWVYPRFMDKFFPELAGAKKATAKRRKEAK